MFQSLERGFQMDVSAPLSIGVPSFPPLGQVFGDEVPKLRAPPALLSRAQLWV